MESEKASIYHNYNSDTVIIMSCNLTTSDRLVFPTYYGLKLRQKVITVAR